MIHLFFLCIFGAIPEHEVTSLPGWSKPLPSKIYSGMLASNAAKTHMQHYFFVLAEENPMKKPIVMWMQGGPGGPSLYGCFVELGPFLLNDNSVPPGSKIPELQYNQYGWQKSANLLFADSPAPVGFSECSDNCGTAENPWDDTKYGVENGNFLKNFFDAYPEFRANPFYITGESYAGVYIPETVKYITANPSLGINLKGFAIGNGCMGVDAGICVPGDGTGNPGMNYHVDYMYHRNQISTKMYQNVISTCGYAALASGAYQSNQECMALLATMDDMVGGYFVYDLYDTCSGDNDNLKGKQKLWTPQGIVQGALNDYTCGGARVFDMYSNLTEVRESLHVMDGDFFWGIDNGWPGYHFTEKDLRPWYKDVLPTLGLKVLIFSGDVDAAVITTWTQDWVDGLGHKQLKPFRPWTLNGAQEMAGHVSVYANNFTFATVRGAGHMVPTTKPRQALTMLEYWLSDQELPQYVKP